MDASGVLIDLGHAGNVNYVYRSGTRVVSLDSNNRWILWDTSTGHELASGLNGVSVAGTVLLTQPTASTMQVRSLADGHVMSAFATLEPAAMLSLDGSYLWSATSDGVSAWSSGRGCCSSPTRANTSRRWAS